MEKWTLWMAQHHIQGPFADLPNSGTYRILRDAAKTRLRQIAASNLRLFATRDRISNIFSENQINFAWLKGMVLTESLYPNIGWRGSNDLDVLVKYQQLPLIRSLFEKAGFVTSQKEKGFSKLKGKQNFTDPDTDSLVEVHWRLTLSSKFPLPPDPFSEGLVSLEQNRLHTPLEWLFLACHNIQHLGVSRWGWLWDLRLLGQKMTQEEWREVEVLAERFQLWPVVAYSHMFLELFFGHGVPLSVSLKKWPKSVVGYLRTMDTDVLESKKIDYYWRTIGNPLRFCRFGLGFFQRAIRG